MKKRAFNFAAGPATLPFEVLEASAAALLDFQGKGFGIAECSHRGKEFDAVLDETIARCRSLLQILIRTMCSSCKEAQPSSSP